MGICALSFVSPRASQTSPLVPDKCNISLMASEISRTGGAEMAAGGQPIDVLSMKADEMSVMSTAKPLQAHLLYSTHIVRRIFHELDPPRLFFFFKQQQDALWTNCP